MNEWISVKDRLPKKEGIYWCFPFPVGKLEYGALYWDGKYFSNGTTIPNWITHFHEMKLEYPDPPQS